MDNNAIKFGTLYTTLLQEAEEKAKAKEKVKALDEALENYRKDPSDTNLTDLCDMMVKIAKNPSEKPLEQS